MRRPPVTIAVAAAGLLLLAACGGEDRNGMEDLEPDAILEEVQTAVDAATSVHVVGSVDDGTSELGLDLRLTAEGGATGTVTNQGQTITVLAVDGSSWFSADEEFWADQAGPELAAQLADKYVEIPAEDSSFSSFTDWDAFWEDLLDPEGEVEKGETTEVDGQPALELIDNEGDDAGNGVLLIALEGEPLPLSVEVSDGGSITFEEWNEDVSIEAPAPEDVVDPATLGSAG